MHASYQEATPGASFPSGLFRVFVRRACLEEKGGGLWIGSVAPPGIALPAGIGFILR